MEKVTHTPTPWHVGPHYHTDIYSRQGFVAECRPMNTPQAIANAEFIVRACNAHDDLVAALKELIGYANETIDGLGIRYTFDARSPLAARVRAALDKAESKSAAPV